jgi:type I restriction enzyme S subunit
LPPIQPEEIPFGIPSSWMWVRLRDVASINAGYSFKSHNLKRDGVRVIRISDFDSNGFLDKSIVKHEFSSKLSNFTIKSKDILVCMTGGTVGKSLLVPEINEQLYLNQRIGRISSLRKVSPSFIDAVIKSNVTQENIKKSITSTNDNISMTMLEEILVPLPPLFEQQRIVEKIEELLPLVEEYGEANSRLESLNSKFPDEIKQSILQYAIQGKLVKQREEEGTAEDLYQQIIREKEQLLKEGKIKKSKPLLPIQPDEIPFEIPPSWKWVKLNEISIQMFSGRTPKYSLLSNENFIIGQKNNQETGLEFYPIKYGKDDFFEHYPVNMFLRNEDVILNTLGGGTVGRCGIFIAPNKKKFITDGHLFVFRTGKSELQWYLYYLLKAGKRQIEKMAEGTTNQSFLKIGQLESFLIPLPPISEQKRIVEKIEELMQLVNELKGEVS